MNRYLIIIYEFTSKLNDYLISQKLTYRLFVNFIMIYKNHGLPNSVYFEYYEGIIKQIHYNNSIKIMEKGK